MSISPLDQYAKLLEDAKQLILAYEDAMSNNDEKQMENIVQNMETLTNQALNYKIDIRTSNMTKEESKEFKKLCQTEANIKRTFNKMQLNIYKSTAISLSRERNGIPKQDDLIIDVDIMAHGRAVQDESIKHLQNVIKITTDTNTLATETAMKIAKQGEQMEKIDDEVAAIETEIERATKVLKRTLRRVATNKFLWVMIGFVVIGIGAIVVLKAI